MLGRNVNVRIGGPITPMVKRLMIINAAIFILQKIIGLKYPGFMEAVFGLSHPGIFYRFMLWQLFTYMFLHGGWFHIIFNLIGLWMFAGELEQRWGSRMFLKYYIYTGVGAGFFIALLNYFTFVKYGNVVPTLGASGALYAILLAYGMTWPNREVLLWFILPAKMKYVVIGFGIFEFIGTLQTAAGVGGNISHIGHVGGLLSGLIYILIKRKRSGLQQGLRSDKQRDKGNIISKSIKKARLDKKKKEIETRIKAKKIIDELLEKIARKGMGSLTEKERKDLEWARRHYYPNEDDTMH